MTMGAGEATPGGRLPCALVPVGILVHCRRTCRFYSRLDRACRWRHELDAELARLQRLHDPRVRPH